MEFEHPSFGDMSYGLFLFCSEEGRDYAYCDAFDASSKLIRALLPEDADAGMY